jgi:type IV secretion system protein TrbL
MMTASASTPDPVLSIGLNPFSPIKGAVQDAAGSFLDSIGKAFCNMAADMSSSVFSFASQKTSVDLSKDYFIKNYDVVFGVAALVVLAIFMCSSIMAAVRGDPHMMVRALASTGTAIMGSFVALALLQMVLAASDGMATTFGAGKPLGQDLVAQLRALPDHGNFALDMVLSLLVALFSFALFMVLYVRKIAILMVALFIPLYLAGQPAGSTRGWMKRATELLAALIFTKPVIYAIFTLGAGLATDGTGSATDQTLAILSGIVVMVASVFSPLVLLYLFGIADVQLAAAIHGGGRRALSSFGQGAGALLGSTSRETFSGIGARLQSRGGAAGTIAGEAGGGFGALTGGSSAGRPALTSGRPSTVAAGSRAASRPGSSASSTPVRQGGAELARGSSGRAAVESGRASNRAGTPAQGTRASGGGRAAPARQAAPAPPARRGSGRSVATPPSAGRPAVAPPTRQPAPQQPDPRPVAPAAPPLRGPGGNRAN